MDIIEIYEEISGRSEELLEGMGRCREQLNILKRQQVKECEAARQRNAALLQDLQKIEDVLRGAKLTHPHLLALETKYWVSVEESVPAWKHFLLDKGPHPIDGPGQTARINKHNPSIGLPPRPKPRGAR